MEQRDAKWEARQEELAEKRRARSASAKEAKAAKPERKHPVRGRHDGCVSNLSTGLVRGALADVRAACERLPRGDYLGAHCQLVLSCIDEQLAKGRLTYQSWWFSNDTRHSLCHQLHSTHERRLPRAAVLHEWNQFVDQAWPTSDRRCRNTASLRSSIIVSES